MTDAEAPPALEFVFAAHVTVDRPLDLGDVGKGGRRIVSITGGEFFGPRLRGKVIPGGADWQIVRNDGVAELEARYTLETDDSALIYVRNHALRHGPAEAMAALAAGRSVDPSSYYFRGATFFETGARVTTNTRNSILYGTYAVRFIAVIGRRVTPRVNFCAAPVEEAF